jgi:hypothetical protein
VTGLSRTLPIINHSSTGAADRIKLTAVKVNYSQAKVANWKLDFSGGEGGWGPQLGGAYLPTDRSYIARYKQHSPVRTCSFGMDNSHRASRSIGLHLEDKVTRPRRQGWAGLSRLIQRGLTRVGGRAGHVTTGTAVEGHVARPTPPYVGGGPRGMAKVRLLKSPSIKFKTPGNPTCVSPPRWGRDGHLGYSFRLAFDATAPLPGKIGTMACSGMRSNSRAQTRNTQT